MKRKRTASRCTVHRKPAVFAAVGLSACAAVDPMLCSPLWASTQVREVAGPEFRSCATNKAGTHVAAIAQRGVAKGDSSLWLIDVATWIPSLVSLPPDITIDETAGLVWPSTDSFVARGKKRGEGEPMLLLRYDISGRLIAQGNLPTDLGGLLPLRGGPTADCVLMGGSSYLATIALTSLSSKSISPGMCIFYASSKNEKNAVWLYNSLRNDVRDQSTIDLMSPQETLASIDVPGKLRDLSLSPGGSFLAASVYRRDRPATRNERLRIIDLNIINTSTKVIDRLEFSGEKPLRVGWAQDESCLAIIKDSEFLLYDVASRELKHFKASIGIRPGEPLWIQSLKRFVVPSDNKLFLIDTDDLASKVVVVLRGNDDAIQAR